MHILRVLFGFRIRLSAAAVTVTTRRRPKTLMSQLFTVSFLLAMLSGSAIAATCSAESGARRVALLELYTSEGCDSCPPADRWVSTLQDRGLTPEQVVTLGFHVDYWNDLGWSDPYAKAQYSARQRGANQRNQSRVVYTPQLLLNGRDYRRGALTDEFAGRVSALARDTPKARISLRVATEPAGVLSVQGAAVIADAAERSEARVYLALYENNLSSQVTAGENRGKRLRHDFVVRALAGPYSTDDRGSASLIHRFRIEPGWKTGDLHVAAFVQNERGGDVLQALALAYCR